jgi:hypothetical protein
MALSPKQRQDMQDSLHKFGCEADQIIRAFVETLPKEPPEIHSFSVTPG